MTVDWMFGYSTREGQVGGITPDVTFHNVTLGLGTFLTEIIGPVAENFDKFAGPLRPVVEFLLQEVPVVSDLNKKSSGEPVTFSDLGVLLIGLLSDNRDIEKLKTRAEQVRRVLTIMKNAYELIDELKAVRQDGGEAKVNFGTFYLTGKPEVEEQLLQDKNDNPLFIAKGTKVELEKVPKAGTAVRVVVHDVDVDPAKFKVIRNSERGGKVSVQFLTDLSFEYGGRITGGLIRYLVDAPEEEDATDEDADVGVKDEKLGEGSEGQEVKGQKDVEAQAKDTGKATAGATNRALGFLRKASGNPNKVGRGGLGIDLKLVTSPSNIFKLLSGEKADIVRWDIPRLELDFDFMKKFRPLKSIGIDQVFVSLSAYLNAYADSEHRFRYAGAGRNRQLLRRLLFR